MNETLITETALQCEILYDNCVNYSMQQNAVPVIRRIAFQNLTSQKYNELTVEITSDPVFCAPLYIRISTLEPEQVYSVSAVDLILSADFLAGLRERVTGHIKITVTFKDTVLLTESHPIDILAYDEWPGIKSLPELLASFVMPNHVTIEPLMREAALVLSEWTNDSSVSGYQSGDPKRVWLIVAAIYTAIQKQKISYINPPASFEHSGQKIRTPDRIIENRLGTCIDLSLLCASCIEAAGLNPVIIILNGHAFPGVWLKDESFYPAAFDDLQAIRKRVDLKELVFFESTALTSNTVKRFDQAVSDAEPHLTNDSDFVYGIDIAAARKARIRPLPIRTEGKFGNQNIDENSSSDTSVLPVIPSDIQIKYEQPETPKDKGQTRLDRWKRKLLDLSLRNRLLNFRESKKTVPILCPDLPGLEDALAAGDAFIFCQKPKIMTEDDPRNAMVHRKRTSEDALDKYLTEELASKRLYSRLEEPELSSRLLETYRSARISQEEGGANVCYLALGFLEWKETEQSPNSYIAPILLLPVQLSRKSIQQGFRLQEHDDEPQINVTLLQMLSKDFGLTINGLDPLPRDHSGIDVPAVFQIFRSAVRDIKGWEVKESVYLGLFSFNKYLMWKDLEARSEDLLKCSVVEHLINNPDSTFPFDGELPNPAKIDTILKPEKTFCPRDADSSQLAAIAAVSQGYDFVMEGPPGTGKSQTITNMIAQCITEGKTVLFVAEKMAALSVVHDRLSEVGLAPFCLELHSNKSNKIDVLKQLGQAVNQLKDENELKWNTLANEISTLRSYLNEYVEVIHRKYPNGLSAFAAIAILASLKDTKYVDLRWQNVDTHDQDAYAKLKHTVEILMTNGNACRTINNNPLVGIEHEEWSPAWAQEVARLLQLLEQNICALQSELDATALKLGFEAMGNSLDQIDSMNLIASILLSSPDVPKSLLEVSDWADTKHQINEIIKIGRERDATRGKIFKNFQTGILNLNFELLQSTWNSSQSSWWPFSWLKKQKVLKQLRIYAKDIKILTTENIQELLSNCISLINLQNTFNQMSSMVGTVLGRFWCNGEADWDQVENVCTWVNDLRNAVFSADSGEISKKSSIYSRICELLIFNGEQLRPEGNFGQKLLSLRHSIAEFLHTRDQLISLASVNMQTIGCNNQTIDILGRMRDLTRRWKSSINELRYWCGWRTARKNALLIGLGPLVEQYEMGIIQTSELQNVFKKNYCLWWLNLLTDQQPVLRKFLREVHEKNIERFCKADTDFIKLTRYIVSARLNKNRPDLSLNYAVGNSELGILTRELQKKKKHLPVRTLLSKIPNVLPRLKPCLLMSPLSVAQYLQTGQQLFDVVIFDEASQIPVWDAVGAIARGKQVVIAGDPKQLPPTNFFNKAQDEESQEDDTKVDDLESILDECMGAGLPLMRLNWHYRSKHESLIAFSNFQYYENSLCTFPSPVTKDNAVSFCHVKNGIYDKGKSRTNVEEARALVAEVIDRLSDPCKSSHSIGIVTFSQAQQVLIEDMLENERLLHPELDEFFSPDITEPVFVKNLENVQGDERDVILFSICYGYDAQGRLSLNFGPMNRDGGERRLNVAVTRARQTVRVFSSITADEIDLRRTQARGVADLKLFLEYAQKGTSILSRQLSRNPDADFDSSFEKEVHDVLTAHGLMVDLQVGCAGYRIDLAVVDVRYPGKYIVGIECDGANYHSAKSARDRDRLRQSVLEGLGWRILRIWSTDWWLDQNREFERILSVIKELQEKGPESDVKNGNLDANDAEDDNYNYSAEPETATNNTNENFTTYKIFTPPASVTKKANQDNFFDINWDPTINSVINGIIECEGPISEDLLIRRISTIWGFARTGDKIRGRILDLIQKQNIFNTLHMDRVWYWHSSKPIEEFTNFRSTTNDEIRQLIDVAPEEIGNAALDILRTYISIEFNELTREVAKIFGYNRLAAHSKIHMDYCINLLIKNGILSFDGEMVILKSDEAGKFKWSENASNKPFTASQMIISKEVKNITPVNTFSKPILESDTIRNDKRHSGQSFSIVALKKKTLSDLSKEEFLYLKDQLTTDQEIGNLFGVSRQAVHQFRMKMGIESSRAGNDERDNAIKKEYKEGKKVEVLSKKYSLSVPQIYRIVSQ